MYVFFGKLYLPVSRKSTLPLSLYILSLKLKPTVSDAVYVKLSVSFARPQWPPLLSTNSDKCPKCYATARKTIFLKRLSKIVEIYKLYYILICNYRYKPHGLTEYWRNQKKYELKMKFSESIARKQAPKYQNIIALEIV